MKLLLLIFFYYCIAVVAFPNHPCPLNTCCPSDYGFQVPKKRRNYESLECQEIPRADKGHNGSPILESEALHCVIRRHWKKQTINYGVPTPSCYCSALVVPNQADAVLCVLSYVFFF